METLRLEALTLTTADYKENAKFKRDVKTKTTYLTLDEKNSELAEAFGLQKYTSEDDGNSFFIIPFAGTVVLFNEQSKTKQKISFNDEIDNFKIENCKLSIVQSYLPDTKKYMNRIKALRVTKFDDMVPFEANYFEDDDDFTDAIEVTTATDNVKKLG